MEAARSAQKSVAEAAHSAGGAVHDRLVAAKEGGAEAAVAAKHKAAHLASDRSVQVAAASAVGGAALLGAGGGIVGLLAGGAAGAAAGLVPALFTFGLSIPAFAAVGGGCGAVAGAAVGGATGLVAGGASGYGLYTRWGAIRSSAAYVKDTACSSAGYVREKLVGGTGGTTR